MKDFKSCLSVSFFSLVVRSSTIAQYAIPSCEKAWNAFSAVSQHDALGILIKNDGSDLYPEGWQLGRGAFKTDQ